MKSTLKKDNTADQHTGYLGTSRVVLNHFDVSTQADIQHQQVINYASEDEIIGRLYAKEKKLITPTAGGGSTLYSKQDIREQYCISERGLGALENNDNNNNIDGKPHGIFGCISSHQSSPCSVRGGSSFLTACVKQKVPSDENLYELYKRHPSEYAPYPKKQRYLWAPLTPPSDLYRHDIDMRRSPANYQRTNHKQPSYYNNYHCYYYGDPSNYNTWMPPADDESVRMEKPKSILDLSHHRNQPSSSAEKKHVSFARSHTLTSFDEAVSFLNNSSSSSSASMQHFNYATLPAGAIGVAARSHERLLDVRKSEMVKNSTITKQPELSENVLILDKIKRTPMKTQATQTEASLNRKSILPNTLGHHINLSPRTIQKVKMVSQAAQTNGMNNGRKLAKSFSEAGNKISFQPNNKDSEIVDHEPLHRTQSDEPPRSPFLIPTTSASPSGTSQRMPPPPTIVTTPPPVFQQFSSKNQAVTASESSSISKSEDHDESEDSVESKKEIFINFKPQQEMNGSKRPLVKTVSDGILLAEQRRYKKIENFTNSNGLRRCNSISRENFQIEENLPFVPYFQKAPIRNEGICKRFDDGNIYSSTDGGFYGQDSLDEEFHENIIYNKKFINRQESETTDENVKEEEIKTEKIDDSIVPKISVKSDMKLSASNDSLTNEAKDQSDGIWNESQATVLQIDAATDSGTPLGGAISLLTPSSRRRHLLLLQHQQRSSFDTETLDEELENQQETTLSPRIVVDRLSTTNNHLDLPSSHLKPTPAANSPLKLTSQHQASIKETPSLKNIHRKPPIGAEAIITTTMPSVESVVPILVPPPPPPLAESPLPAVVPDLLLARTDSCKTNTDLSESTTTDDYITATSGTDSSRKSGNEKYELQQKQLQNPPHLPQQQQQKQQHKNDQNHQQHIVVNHNEESSFDSAKGSFDIVEDMVVPSISPRRNFLSPIGSPGTSRMLCHTPLPPGGSSPPSDDNDNDIDDDGHADDDDNDDSSSCGSYSVGASIPDLLDKFSASSNSPKRVTPSSPWYRGSDNDNDMENKNITQKHYSASVDDFTMKATATKPSKSKNRNDFHLDLHKPKRSKSKARVSPSQSTPGGHKKGAQGRRSPYREKSDDKQITTDDDESSTGKEYSLTQTSPRKSKKNKDGNRRRSLPRSPMTSKSYNDRKPIDYDHYNSYHSHHHHHHHPHHHHHFDEPQQQSVSLPGSLCRRKSSTKQPQEVSNNNITTGMDTISTNTTTLKALSAESLRSVSPGSDSVFYSDPSSHTTDHHLHCLHCGKEVEVTEAAVESLTNDVDRSLTESVVDGLEENIVEPPAGFEDSPKASTSGGGGGGSGGRLFKKVEKRTKSQDERGEHHRRHHRHHKSDVRAKSEERAGGSSSTAAASRGSLSSYKNRLRPMARSPFCSREHLLKTTTSSPSVLPGAPYNDDDPEANDRGIYNAHYDSGVWLFIDERDEVQGGVYSSGTEPSDQQIRHNSISSTESEHDFRRRFQLVTHRMVQRRSCLEMYKKQVNKSFECDKTVSVRRERNGEFGFRIHGSKPVVVSAIESGTPAEQSGLEVGDIILSVNGVSVLEKTHSDVVKIAHAGSDTLTLEVARSWYALGSKNHDQIDGNTLYCGYLWKLTGYASGMTINGLWLRRWFCLKQNNCLYYYKTENDRQPVGVILLFEHEVRELSNDDGKQSTKPNRFVIQRSDTVPMHLAADTPHVRNIWIDIIGRAIANSNSIDQFLEETNLNSNLPPHAITNPDCSGNLIKLGTQWTSWSRPYCILKDACLYFYQDANASSAFGVVYLQGYKVQQSLTGSKKHAFEIIPLNSDKRCYYFHAESEIDKKRWITALEYSIDKWLKVS